MSSSASLTAEKLTEAYLQYAAQLLRHCMRHTRSNAEAEDTMQEAFLKTWQYLQAGQRVENMKAFLYSVANHLIADHYRRMNGNGHLSLDVLLEQGFDVGDESPKVLQEALDAKKVLQHLKVKKDREYDLLVLRYFGGLIPSEIAWATGLRPNTVAVRLHRVLKRLGKEFSKVAV